MAKWLGMSLRLKAPDLPTAIMTDSDDPELSEFFNHRIPHRAEFGQGVSAKLHLDRFSPFEETIFVDPDCLVLNDLRDLWPVFQDLPVGFLGWRYLTRTDSDTNVDVPFVLEHFKLERLAKFNSGCIYFRSGEATTAFFDLARRLASDATRLRIRQFNGGAVHDEPVFALALELSGMPVVSAGIKGMWTPWGLRGPIRLDVFSGECSFEKQGMVVTPDIVHFPGGFRETYEWHREIWRLQAYFGKPQPSYLGKRKMAVLSALRILLRAVREFYQRTVKGQRLVRIDLDAVRRVKDSRTSV
jgi:hypothetical protein